MTIIGKIPRQWLIPIGGGFFCLNFASQNKNDTRKNQHSQILQRQHQQTTTPTHTDRTSDY